MSDRPVRVVLANDDPIIIEGTARLLTGQSDEVEVVAPSAVTPRSRWPTTSSPRPT